MLVSAGTRQVFFCVPLTVGIKATPLPLILISRWPCQPPRGLPPTFLSAPIPYIHFLRLALLSLPVSLSFSTYLIPSCTDLFVFHFFSFRICALKLSSGVKKRMRKRSECDSLLTARRERTKDTEGKGTGIACVYYSSPVLSRSVRMYNTD